MSRSTTTPQQRLNETRAWLASLDYTAIAQPDGNPDDLRHIGNALLRTAEAENDIARAVRAARTSGHTWGQIAAILGVTRQAATEKYGG